MLKIRNKKYLYETVQQVPSATRAEVLGQVAGEITTSKIEIDAFKKLMAIWAPQLSDDEKRRFLKTAAREKSHLEMIEFMDLVEWKEFDVSMIATEKTTVMRRCFSRFSEPARVKSQLESWIDFRTVETVRIIRQSPFLSPILESTMAMRMRPDRVIAALKVLCAAHRIIRPKAVAVGSFSAKLEQLVCAFGRGEMSEGDVAAWVRMMLKLEPELKDLAMSMANHEPRLAKTVKAAIDDPNSAIDRRARCEQTGKAIGHHKTFNIKRIKTDIEIEEAKASIVSSESTITVVYRATNHPLYESLLAVLAWQFEAEGPVYVFDCLHEPNPEEIGLMKALFDRNLRFASEFMFREMALNTFGCVPRPFHLPRSYGNVLFLKKVTGKKTPFCSFSSLNVILEESDINESLHYHLAAEANALSAHGRGV